MADFGYSILEYLLWVAVALALVVVVFLCLAIGVALTSAVNPLAAKWKISSNVKPPGEPEPVSARPVRMHLLRKPEFLQRRKAASKPVTDKPRPPETSAESKRRVG